MNVTFYSGIFSQAPPGLLAHGGPGHLIEGAVHFGRLWLVLVPNLVLAAGAAAVLWRRGRGREFLARLGDGAAAVTGLPDWVALPVLTMLAGALPTAALGFYWDVAWHVDTGRDEFLFSPPHIALLAGLGLIGVAGWLGVTLATRSQVTTAWRLGRLRVPLGAAALVVAGFIALAGFSFDEMWHWAYGLDVSMWGPTHVTMISAAAFSPFALWTLMGEAGPSAGRAPVVRALRLTTAGIMVVGLSAWQLEFDLGVQQWQQLYHPVLVAFAAGLSLTFSRAALGPGGALAAALAAVAVRALFSGVVFGLGLTVPRFPLYLAAALAVEVVAGWGGHRPTLRHGLAAGAGIATFGLAGAAVWTQLWGWRPWNVTLMPGLWIAVAVAVATAVLGLAAGRIAVHRPSGLRAGTVAACFAVLALGVLVPLPRRVPDASATVRTTAAGPGLVHLRVDVQPATLAGQADWFEVFSWQGGDSRHADLVEVSPGRFEAAAPMPVGGSWKTMIMYASRDQRGAVPVFLPEDPAIGASQVPVVPERTAPFGSETAVLQREAHDGPAWPGIVAYTWVVTAVTTLLGAIVAGYVALERRRRAAAWNRPPDHRPLAGRRVVVTGSAGGIGAGLVATLEAHGARVVGIDLVPLPGDVAADLTDPAAAEAAMAEAERRLGGIDVLVNNAGVATAGDSGVPPDARARATLEVNLFGTWQATAAALPALLAARHQGDAPGPPGQVVNVASGLAVAAMPYAAAYSASKRAVLAYSDALRMEYGDRLTVSAVLPGYIRTPIHDGPAAEGASLDGIVPAEPVAAAVAAIVAAIETRRRAVASTPRLHLELTAARLFPALAERVIARRVRRAASTRPQPSFLRFPQPAPATTATSGHESVRIPHQSVSRAGRRN